MVKKYKGLKLCIVLLIFSVLPAVVYGQRHKVDSLLNLLKTAKEDTNKVNMLNALSRQLGISGSYDSALAFGEEAQKLSGSLAYKKGVAYALTYVGVIYYYQGNYSKAQEYALKALPIYQDINDKRGLSLILSHIGNGYSELCDYSKAIEYTFKALAINREINDKQNIAYNLSNIGLAYFYQDDYPNALSYDLKALSMSGEINDKRFNASVLGDIGSVYGAQGNYPDALKYYFKALDISEQIGNKTLTAHDFMNTGSVYENQGKYDTARKYYLKGLALFRDVNYQIGLAFSFTNIAGVDEKQKKFQDAIDNNNKALSIAKKIGYKRIIARCYTELGSIDIQRKKPMIAKKYLDSALVVSNIIGEKTLIADTYNKYAQLDSSIGNDKGALENYKKYFMYHDSIVNEVNAKKVVQTEMTFEFEQTQAAEKAAQDKKDAIRDAEDAKHKAESKIQKVLIGLSASIAIMLILLVILVFQRMKGVEKKKLIVEQQKSWLELKALRTQMNPHFLYNTINSIQSFILKNDTRASTNYLAQFAGLMRGVLENSRKDKITLAEEVEGLTNYLDFEVMRFPAKFDYRIKVDDKLDTAKILLPPLLIQPYVENAIWHGLMHKKSGGGELIITFENIDNHLKCTVDDNGIGRKMAGEMKKESVHKSVGLSIVAERIESMNKMYHWDMKIEVIDKYNEDGTSAGTKAELLFPLILNTINYA